MKIKLCNTAKVLLIIAFSGFSLLGCYLDISASVPDGISLRGRWISTPLEYGLFGDTNVSGENVSCLFEFYSDTEAFIYFYGGSSLGSVERHGTCSYEIDAGSNTLVLKNWDTTVVIYGETSYENIQSLEVPMYMEDGNDDFFYILDEPLILPIEDNPVDTTANPLSWVRMDKMPFIKRYTLLEPDTEIMSPDDQPGDVAFDGENIWMAGVENDTLYKIDTDGNVLWSDDAFSFSSKIDFMTYIQSGLTYDNGVIYVSDTSGVIHCIDTTTHSEIDTITLEESGKILGLSSYRDSSDNELFFTAVTASYVYPHPYKDYKKNVYNTNGELIESTNILQYADIYDDGKGEMEWRLFNITMLNDPWIGDFYVNTELSGTLLYWGSSSRVETKLYVLPDLDCYAFCYVPENDYIIAGDGNTGKLYGFPVNSPYPLSSGTIKGARL